MISVIIPSYNQGIYLPEAITSVLEQSYQDFEIIIVDDGSTDETKNKIQKFLNDRIKYIYQKNKGAGAARNTGFSNSKGEFIAFLDADDWYLPQKLEMQVKILQSEPGIDLVFGGWTFCTATGETIQKVSPWDDFNVIDLDAWLLGVPFVIHGALFRRTALNKSGLFNELYISSEDWDLFLRLAASKCKMVWSREIVCRYRLHQNNSTTQLWRIKDKVNVLNNFFASNINLPIPLRIRNIAFSKVFLQISEMYYAQNIIDDAQRFMNLAIEYDPKLIIKDTFSNYPIEREIYNWSLEPRINDPVIFINTVMNNLPEKYIFLKNFQRKILSNIFILKSFISHGNGKSNETIKFIGKGFISNPKCVFNRGVLSLFRKSIFAILYGKG